MFSLVKQPITITCLFLCGALTLLGQRMTPETPVREFILPMFGPDGYKIWDLRGREGRYVSPTEIIVTAMTLRTFGPQDPTNPETIIQSPIAVINPEESTAQGEDFLHIHDAEGHYSIIGRNWKWEGKKNKITILAEARVTFQQSLGSILE